MHPATKGFDTSAVAYERARPSYPPEAIEGLGVPAGALVLDLAAGTGKLTRLLVATGARVVGLEPSDGMRAQFHAAAPLVGAVTEGLPFAAGAFDVVVVGQAFHWFDGPRALAEIHRVLRPGGRLGMLWNVRQRSVEWTQRLAELTEPYRAGVPAYRTGEWRKAFDATALFTPLEGRTYPYADEVDADTMVDRMASISWVASLPDAERAGLLARVRALFDGMPPRFPVPHHTDVWWVTRLPR